MFNENEDNTAMFINKGINMTESHIVHFQPPIALSSMGVNPQNHAHFRALSRAFCVQISTPRCKKSFPLGEDLGEAPSSRSAAQAKKDDLIA